MKKFLVETYYTCTFKTVHTLNDLNDKELSKIDERTDGDVEVLDVKLNNRKTKRVGQKDDKKIKKLISATVLIFIIIFLNILLFILKFHYKFFHTWEQQN